MGNEKTEVLVIGAGQAGIAMSEHLGVLGIEHLVLERDRVAERWRSWRWDSLVANGPAWHDRFPTSEFACAPDAFAGKEDVADYLAAHAEKVGAPIRTGVEVTKVCKREGRPGFTVETSDGTIDARFVVAATGAFQKPIIPTLVPQSAPLTQLHSSDYHHPRQLPDGAVMVIGAGSSGVQIADELQRSGRQVYLAVGPHDRPP
ncbi:MAG: NAD(P)/FAD-dependent oxidoreductase, partial [Gordonia sp. (in: high G+C Gram-positive bacteria)]